MPIRAAPETLHEVMDSILEASVDAGFPKGSFLSNDDLDDLRKAFSCRASSYQPGADPSRRRSCVLVGKGEWSSILVNEEDHLRIQSVCSGSIPFAPGKRPTLSMNSLGRSLQFSFSKR
jgi:protein-arginine kinase